MSQPIPDDAAHWNWEATFWDDYTFNASEEDIQFLIEEAQASGSRCLR